MSKFADPLIKALEECEAQFRDYAKQHSAKGTMDGAQKAHTNLLFAMKCRTAVADFRRGVENCEHADSVPFPVGDAMSSFCLECGQLALPHLAPSEPA